MVSGVSTPTQTQSYNVSSNIRAIITACFALFSIYAIVRYTSRFMESGYRTHLLNMAIWILACDLTISVLCRPRPLLPMSAGCFSGELNALAGLLEVQQVFDIEFVSCF
jgi:hypothetical protein